MSNIPIPPPPGAPGYQSASTSTGQFHGVQYYVQLPGMHGQSFSFDQLSSMAAQRVVKPGSLVQVVGEPYWSPASAVPGVFSEKSYIAAMILAWFLGVFGVDRFYLGYTGIGLLKLFTFGGLGIWAFIDFVLIALRRVSDREGKPLS
jgi:hypothetical protein